MNHWFSIASRQEKGIKSRSGAIPHPLVGDGELPNGEKVRVEIDEKGQLYVHLLPSAPIVSQDGKSIELSLDAKDEKLISKIQAKIYKKNNIDPATHRIITTREEKLIEHPKVHMQFKIDMKNFRIGLLKIAYEFTIDKIPQYYNDPIAHLYSEILCNANLDRLEEVKFCGDAFSNSKVNILESMIDSNNTNRHILLLLNSNGKLYCMVKLFDTFCQMIQMSNQSYGDDGIVAIAINDFTKNTCKFFTLEELINATMRNEITSFKFDEKGQKVFEEELAKDKTNGIACNEYRDNFLFDQKGNCICTEGQLLLKLEVVGDGKACMANDKMSVTYRMPQGYHYLLMPSRKLLLIKEITKTNIFQKI